MHLTRYIAYIGVHNWRIFFRGFVGSKPQTVILVLCQILEEVTVGSVCRIQVGFI